MIKEHSAERAPAVDSPVEVMPEPGTVEETGLDIGFLADLILKALYY